MKSASTYSGFDFEGTWELDTASKYPLPTLRQVPHMLPEENTVDFAGGTGEPWDPYVIKTKEHLDHIHHYTDAHFILNNDLAFSESDFSSTGDFYNQGEGWRPVSYTHLQARQNRWEAYSDGFCCFVGVAGVSLLIQHLLVCLLYTSRCV